MSTRTNSLTQSTIDLLTAKGFFAWRSNNIPVSYIDKNGKQRYRKFAGVKGVADVLACAPLVNPRTRIPSGTLCCFEIKTGKDKQSPDQVKFQHEIEKRGGVYFIVQDTIDGLVELLRGEGY